MLSMLKLIAVTRKTFVQLAIENVIPFNQFTNQCGKQFVDP